MVAKKTSAIKAVTRAVARATGRSVPAEQDETPARRTTSAGAAAATKKSPAKKAATKKVATKKVAAKKSVTKTAAAKKATKAPAKATKAAKTAPASKTAPATNTAKATRATKAPARGAASTSMSLAVREGEKPWTAREIAEVRTLLHNDEERLQVEISAVEEEIGHLLREGGEGAGHDQADVGSNTFERDHEMSMAKNAKENLVMVKEAIGRIDDGTYGVCESCGRPVGKMRLQAFPRATLCMECKQRQERR